MFLAIGSDHSKVPFNLEICVSQFWEIFFCIYLIISSHTYFHFLKYLLDVSLPAENVSLFYVLSPPYFVLYFWDMPQPYLPIFK